MILIKKEDYEEIIACAVKELPAEACGLLGGTVDGEEKRVGKVYCLTNQDASSRHFSMEPEEQFRAIRDMRANGLTMIGNWHSHPESPAIPSGEDKRLAYDSDISYLILSLEHADKPVLNAFAIVNGDVSEEEIIILRAHSAG